MTRDDGSGASIASPSRPLLGPVCLRADLGMLGRARLQEYFQRVLREDMLTLFNHTASLKALECSIVLQGPQRMSDETRYRAACVLELLTGQRVFARECDIMQEDPSQRMATEAQKRELERARGEFFQRVIQGNRKKNSPKTDPTLVAQQMKKLGSGLKLATTLHNVKMYYFLEKAREFYLPDIIGNAREDSADGAAIARKNWRPATQGHDNKLEKRALVMQFEKRGGSKRDCYPARYPVRRDENPQEAISCYTLRSTDLLKFPDIELHFEALGPVLGDRSNSQALQLILRPTIAMHSPLDRESLTKIPPVDNLRIMNYLLSQFFNSYMTRPHLSSPN